MDGCRRFENTIPGNTELGGPEAEVVRACGAGGPGVERGTVVGAENVRPEATLPAWGGSIKFEDHVLSLPAKSMIAWACQNNIPQSYYITRMQKSIPDNILL